MHLHLRRSLVVLGLAAAALTALYNLAPQTLVGPLLTLNRRVAGLEVRSAQVGPHTLHYLEGGEGPPVLLLHGLFADKDHWSRFAGGLTARHRVVALDLPGFGDSTRLAGEDYRYDAQVQRLRAFVQAVGLERFHLAGSSMGGALAALYAERYPEQVLSVAFIGAPHGLPTPVPSPFDLEIARGATPLVVTTPEGFERLADRMFVQRPFLPGPVREHLARRAVRDVRGDVAMWHAHRAQGPVVQAVLPRLALPTFSLWGAQDQVFHVSGAPLLHALPGHVGHVLEDVGHLPMLEQPGATAALYRTFVEGLAGSSPRAQLPSVRQVASP